MAIFSIAGCKEHHAQQDPDFKKDPNFRSENISRTATIMLDGKPERVFPLFGAFEERKWADGWNPVLVFPEAETILEGTTFMTHGHGHGEDKFTWIVNHYDPDRFRIEYLVYTDNRHWTITITCKALPADRTAAEITYAFTGHNELGNTINRYSLDKMYAQELKDWETAINDYLARE